MYITGSQSGSNINIIEGMIDNVDNFSGIAIDSAFQGEIGLGDVGTAVLTKNCSLITSPITGQKTTFNMKGVGRLLKGGFGGDLRIISSSAACDISVGLSYGSVEFDSSCVGGVALIRGNGYVIDNSAVGMAVTDNTFNTASVWKTPIDNYSIIPGTTAEALAQASTASGSVSVDVASIVSGVYNASKSTFDVAGSFGEVFNVISQSVTDVSGTVNTILETTYVISSSVVENGVYLQQISSSVNDIQVDTGSIAEGVWKYTLTDSTSSIGSAGATLYDVSQNLSVSGSSPTAIADAVWGAQLSQYTGSEGAAASRVSFILGLMQHNFKMVNQVYDSDNNMTSANLRIYTNSADADADTNHTKEWSLTAVYTNGLLTDYKVIE